MSIVRAPDGDLSIKNRAARDLLSVVVNAPGKGLFFFPQIADGQTVALRQGRALGASPSATPLGTHLLSSASFRDAVEARTRGAGVAWEAVDGLTGTETDWWPSDVPVLIGMLEGGEGRSQDSGLRLDVDRLFVRVVGFGGVL